MMSKQNKEVLERYNLNSGTKPKSLRLYEEDIDWLVNEAKRRGIRMCDLMKEMRKTYGGA